MSVGILRGDRLLSLLHDPARQGIAEPVFHQYISNVMLKDIGNRLDALSKILYDRFALALREGLQDARPQAECHVVDKGLLLQAYRKDIVDVDWELNLLGAQQELLNLFYAHIQAERSALEVHREIRLEICDALVLGSQPIQRLPDDVLSLVLLEAGSHFWNPFKSGHLHVCGRWRRLLLEDPRCWAKIGPFDARDIMEKSSPFVALCLRQFELSKNAPLSFHLQNYDGIGGFENRDTVYDAEGALLAALTHSFSDRKIRSIRCDMAPRKVVHWESWLSRLNLYEAAELILYGTHVAPLQIPPSGSQQGRTDSKIRLAEVDDVFLRRDMHLFAKTTHLALTITQFDVGHSLDSLRCLTHLSVRRRGSENRWVVGRHSRAWMGCARGNFTALSHLEIVNIADASEILDAISAPVLASFAWIAKFDEHQSDGIGLESLASRFSNIRRLTLSQSQAAFFSEFHKVLPRFAELEALHMRPSKGALQSVLHTYLGVLDALGCPLEDEAWLCPMLRVLDVWNDWHFNLWLGYEVTDCLLRVVRARSLCTTVAPLLRVAVCSELNQREKVSRDLLGLYVHDVFDCNLAERISVYV